VTAAPVQPFIQIVEVWTPTADRCALELHGGLFGEHEAFKAISRKLYFGYGEGLPGRAWAERRPVIFTDLQQAGFVRRVAARRDALTCAVGLPIFAGDYLLAVLAFFCGADEQRVGAIELWHNDPTKSAEMSFIEGYFGVAENFEWAAKNVRFMRGFGLPGIVWQSGMPEVMADLGRSTSFVRRDDARRVGINKGLGIPSTAIPGQNYVLTFLSALGTPIARRFEVWVPDAQRVTLKFQDGDCDRNPGFAADYAGVSIERGVSPLGLALMTGLPTVSENLREDGSPLGASARKAQLASMVAIPVLEDGRLRAVVGMYF
jgi:hypothetical protein